MDHVSEKPDVGLLTSATDAFVNEMDAVRELLAVTTKSIAHLDDRDRSLLGLIGDRLPQSLPEQRRAALDRWRKALKELDASGRARETAKAQSDEPESRNATDIPILKKTLRDINNLLDNSHAFHHVVAAWGETVERPRRTPLLHAALLTTAVSGFEVLVSRIVRSFFSLRPGALRATDTRYTLAEIEGFATLDEFRDFCADRYVDSLMFGGLDDWIAWFGKQLKITWPDFTSDADEVREIFQRRHLVVHNGGVVNRQYLLKLPGLSRPPAVGSRLNIGRNYCEQAIDTLTLAGVLLGVRVIRKLDNPTGHVRTAAADELASDSAFKFLKQRRDSLVIAIVDSEIDLCASEYTKQIMKVNRWIARKASQGLDSIRAEVEEWQTSALNKRFVLARLALLDQHEEATELGLELRGAGELTIEEWLTWPLLRSVREYEAELAMKKNPLPEDEVLDAS